MGYEVKDCLVELLYLKRRKHLVVCEHPSVAVVLVNLEFAEFPAVGRMSHAQGVDDVESLLVDTHCIFSAVVARICACSACVHQISHCTYG